MSVNANVGDCALCGQNGPLVQSHLIPDFVFRAFKRESITGYMRDANNPDIRRQGGPTIPLLCAQCDNVRFSRAEAAFASDIFVPHKERTLTDFTVTEEHRYFAASLTWRNVIFKLRPGEDALRADDHTNEDIAAMRDVEELLRKYLMGEIPYPEKYQQHIYFAGLTVGESPYGLDAYLNAAVEMYCPGTLSYLYSVVNLSFGILIVCPLRTDDERRAEWQSGSTLLQPQALIRTSDQKIEDGHFGDLLTNRPEQLLPYKKISERPQAKISEDVGKADKPGFAG